MQGTAFKLFTYSKIAVMFNSSFCILNLIIYPFQINAKYSFIISYNTVSELNNELSALAEEKVVKQAALEGT